MVPSPALLATLPSEAFEHRTPPTVAQSDRNDRTAPSARATEPVSPPPAADRLLVDTDPASLAPPSPGEDLNAREARLVASIDRTIDTQLELFERIRRLEEIQQALRTQLENELSLPPSHTFQPSAETARIADDERIPVRDGPAPARAQPAPWSDLLIWSLLALVVILLVLLLRRPSTSRQATATAQDANPPGPATAPRAELAEPATSQTAASYDTPLERRKSAHLDMEWDRVSRAEAPPPSRTVAPPLSLPPASEPPTLAPVNAADEDINEYETALELADIMVSFGRLQGAAETLSEFIRTNPKQALTPWIKLLEVYRAAEMQTEFDALAKQLNKAFNVRTVTWSNFDSARRLEGSVEAMPHILERLQSLWGTRDCQAYIDYILRDNREGTRQGLGLGIVDDLLVLNGILEAELGRYESRH